LLSLSVLPLNQSPWKLKPLSGCSSLLPIQWGTLFSSIKTFDHITSCPGFLRTFINRGSPSRLTSSTIPKIPASGFTDLMDPSSAIHIWARSSPINTFPAMAVVVFPHPLGAAPATHVTRSLGPFIPVINICSDNSFPEFS